MDTAETTTQGATTQQADLTSKGRSHHKLGILKALAPECKLAEGADDSRSDKFSYPVNNVIGLKV